MPIFARRVRVLAIVFVGMAASVAAADLAAFRFAGVLVYGGRTNVVLVDSSNGHSSGWIQIGQRFEDAVIERYDAKSDTVTVSSQGTRRDVPLVSAKTISSGRTVQVGAFSYQVLADRTESANGIVFFHGNVTALNDKNHVSAHEAVFDPATGTFAFEGDVRIQRGSILVSGSYIELSADGDGENPRLVVKAPSIRLEPNH